MLWGALWLPFSLIWIKVSGDVSTFSEILKNVRAANAPTAKSWAELSKVEKEPEIDLGSQPVPVPTPGPLPAPAPAPQPVPEPAPAPEQVLPPEPALVPAPAPSPERVPAQSKEQEAQSIPDLEPVPEPAAAAAPEQASVPVPAAAPVSVPATAPAAAGILAGGVVDPSGGLTDRLDEREGSATESILDLRPILPGGKSWGELAGEETGAGNVGKTGAAVGKLATEMENLLVGIADTEKGVSVVAGGKGEDDGRDAVTDTVGKTEQVGVGKTEQGGGKTWSQISGAEEKEAKESFEETNIEQQEPSFAEQLLSKLRQKESSGNNSELSETTTEMSYAQKILKKIAEMDSKNKEGNEMFYAEELLKKSRLESPKKEEDIYLTPLRAELEPMLSPFRAVDSQISGHGKQEAVLSPLDLNTELSVSDTDTPEINKMPYSSGGASSNNAMVPVQDEQQIPVNHTLFSQPPEDLVLAAQPPAESATERSGREAEQGDMLVGDHVEERNRNHMVDWVISQFHQDDELLPEAVRDSTAASLLPKEAGEARVMAEGNDKRSDSVKGFESPESKLSKFLANAIAKLKQKGLQIGGDQDGKCGKNEVFLLNKEKMILVSTGSIAHDITGMARFEDNLMRQIQNQENIIKTLKTRLEGKENQAMNMQNIVRSFKANEESSKRELSFTRQLLERQKVKIESLENKTLAQIQIIDRERTEASALKVRLSAKEREIEDLTNKLKERMEDREAIYLREELENCQEELREERKAKVEMQLNFDNASARAMKGEPGRDNKLLESQIKQQDIELNLVKEQIMEQKLTIELLNKIILQKDEIVIGLQEQVHEFLDHDRTNIKECGDKDKLIESQYEALSNLKNLSLCQDKYTQARDTALKILQNTVYEMVEKIPSCKDEAISGLREEIVALTTSKSQPFEDMFTRLQKSLKATETLNIQSNTNGSSYQHLQAVYESQSRALDLCQMEAESQKITRELFTEFQNNRSQSQARRRRSVGESSTINGIDGTNK